MLLPWAHTHCMPNTRKHHPPSGIDCLCIPTSKKECMMKGSGMVSGWISHGVVVGIVMIPGLSGAARVPERIGSPRAAITNGSRASLSTNGTRYHHHDSSSHEEQPLFDKLALEIAHQDGSPWNSSQHYPRPSSSPPSSSSQVDSFTTIPLRMVTQSLLPFLTR